MEPLIIACFIIIILLALIFKINKFAVLALIGILFLFQVNAIKISKENSTESMKAKSCRNVYVTPSKPRNITNSSSRTYKVDATPTDVYNWQDTLDLMPHEPCSSAEKNCEQCDDCEEGHACIDKISYDKYNEGVEYFKSGKQTEQSEQPEEPSVLDDYYRNIPRGPPELFNWMENEKYSTCYKPPAISLDDCNLGNHLGFDELNARIVSQRTRDKKCMDGFVTKNANYYKKHFGRELDEAENRVWWGASEY